MIATIKDIAARVGVSPSTVSRALSGSDQISEETRARVLGAAEELDYAPNLLARNLVRARNNIIGALILEFANPFFVPVIAAIEDVAEDLGYVTMISQSRRTLEIEERIMRRFRMVRVSGVIITPVLEDITHLLEMKERGTPVIVLGRNCDELDTITIDNRLGGALVARHFLENGHRQIGVVISGESSNEPEQSRLKGVRRTLGEAGLSRRESWIISTGTSDASGGRRAAEAWRKLAEPPTAVFCATDRLAMGFIHRLLERGLHVPADVSVAGFDDIPLAEYMEVPLTTVAYPKYRGGELAARRLIDLIENGAERWTPEKVLLKPRLIVRESSGAMR